MRSSKTKYSNDYRRNLVTMIEGLERDEDYSAIFDILLKDDNISNNGYTRNANGVFLNLSIVSDKTITRMTRYLNSIQKDTDEFDSTPIQMNDETRNNHHEQKRTYKMTNYEKNIIKHRNLKQSKN